MTLAVERATRQRRAAMDLAAASALHGLRAGVAVRWCGRLRARTARILARTGARLALLQSAAVVMAFVFAGDFSSLAIDRITREQVQRAVAGEMGSMDMEYRALNVAHLPAVVAKRTRLWRGFDYRWQGPSGHGVTGDLPPAAAPGWSTERAKTHHSAGDHDAFLILTKRLPDGAMLSVGQNLAAAQAETSAVTGVLILSGVLGVGFCIAASFLFSRGSWLRIDDLVRSARAVADGHLHTRALVTPRPAGDDLDDLAGAFNTMLDQLERLIAQVRQVSSDIAHDLRTPLTRVRQRLERLREADSDAEARLRAIDRIENDLDEVLGMFSALLRLAEIEGDGAGASDGSVDLARLVVHMADTYRPDIEADGRSLTVEASPAAVLGDARLITQAIANLLDNVLRHTPAGTPVLLRAGQDHGAPFLSVTDRGPGVPAEAREAVLRRFLRLDASRPGTGTGLGLALVAATARRHRARVTPTDAGPGLTVTLAFAANP